LRLEQSGDAVRGNFQSDSVLIDVTGIVDGDGTLSLQGSAPGLGRGDFVGAATLTRFRAQVDSVSGLTGALEYRLDRTAETPLGFSTVYAGDIASAQRSQTSLPSTFDGTWAGSFVVRQCQATCLPPHVDEVSGFTLTLRQNGSSIAGAITFRSSEPALQVSGHVDGNRLILDSSPTGPATRILEWSTERDRYGRMLGSFTYQEAGIIRVVQLGTVWLRT
jgi:hypothetical protein